MRDREIVAAIISGDPAGLAAAYDGYAAALHAYCRSLLAEPADAADAVQDTFVIAAAKLADLRDPDRLRPWLYAVARNECYRRLRGQARFAALDEAGDVNDTSADVSSGTRETELRELLTAALTGLNPGDREVIALNLRHDLDGHDLADALGVPLNQAHALASRARGQLERSLGALLVARTGREACVELDALLAGWDGTLTILLRKRVSRHIENCTVCGERKRRTLSPAALFSVLPLVGLPPSLRQHVLRLVSDTSPEAVRYRALTVSNAGRFTASGFPVQLSPGGQARKHGIRAHPVPLAIAAALIVLAGGGGAAYAVKHDHNAAGHHPAGVTVTITAPPKAAATTAQSTPTATSASPTTSPAVAPSSVSASPTVSPGTVELSTQTLYVKSTSSFTLTAAGGPVTYSISLPAEEKPYLTVSPQNGTLQSGQRAQITVTIDPTFGAPSYSNTATVDPGGIVITIYDLDVIQ